MTTSIRDIILGALAPKPSAGLMTPGITLVGDSIGHGGIAERLRVRGIYVHDITQPCDTAANAWRRFPYDTRHTSTVVLQPGTNDLTSGDDPLPYLEKMARYALAEGRKVVFTGITERADQGTSGVDRQVENLARRLDAGYAAWYWVPLTSPDGLHPDSVMADALAANLADTLRGLL